MTSTWGSRVDRQGQREFTVCNLNPVTVCFAPSVPISSCFFHKPLTAFSSPHASFVATENLPFDTFGSVHILELCQISILLINEIAFFPKKTKAACGLQQKNSGTFSAPLKAVRDKISDRRLECVARRFGKFFWSRDWWLWLFMSSDSRKLLLFWVILPTFFYAPWFMEDFLQIFSKLFPSFSREVSTNFLLLPSTKVSKFFKSLQLSIHFAIFPWNFPWKFLLKMEIESRSTKNFHNIRIAVNSCDDVNVNLHFI